MKYVVDAMVCTSDVVTGKVNVNAVLYISSQKVVVSSVDGRMCIVDAVSFIVDITEYVVDGMAIMSQQYVVFGPWEKSGVVLYISVCRVSLVCIIEEKLLRELPLV